MVAWLMRTFLCRLLSEPPSTARPLDAEAPDGAARAFVASLHEHPPLPITEGSPILPLHALWVVVSRADGTGTPTLHRVEAQLVVEYRSDEGHLHPCPNCLCEHACLSGVCEALENFRMRLDGPPLSETEKRCDECNNRLARSHKESGGMAS